MNLASEFHAKQWCEKGAVQNRAVGLWVRVIQYIKSPKDESIVINDVQISNSSMDTSRETPMYENNPKHNDWFTTWPNFSWCRDAHDHDAQVREEAQHAKDSHHTNQPGIANNGPCRYPSKWPWGLEVFGSQQIMFNTHYVSKVFVRWVGGNLRQRLSFKIGTDSQQKKAEVSNTRPERIDSRYRFRYENYIVLCACVNKYIYICI